MKKIHAFAVTCTIGISILLLGCFLAGCGSASDDDDDYASEGSYYYPETQNILFYGTWEMPLEITPDVPDPSFAWHAHGLKYVVITIFKDKIDLKDNRIANTEDAVWTWNTGLGKGREGNISFSDGKDVINGETRETVTPLSPGTYYIAGWAYDDEYDLIYSSKEYQHLTGNQ